jgi:para-aminobenzoate synthetase / 4-amino-4-deoxychorismate lyase
MTGLPASRDPARVFAPASGAAGAILLETQRPDVRDRFSYLLKDPVEVLIASRLEDVPGLLEEAGERQRKGFAVAGCLAYEAGFALDPAFAADGQTAHHPFPFLWLGVYPGLLRYDHSGGRWTTEGAATEWPDGDGNEPPPAAPFPETPEELPFSIPEEDYAARVEAIRRAIAEGALYQANLTGAFAFPFSGDPFALYLRLRAVQPVPYGAFLRTEAGCIVSQSPELFFRVRGERIETRPMKGTASRGLTDGEDRRAASALAADPKNRAENVMIVDLLRNDLGRLCRPGTVRVPRLFEVQRFRTVLQMVPTVTGRLLPGTTPAALFRALFPCGSVTGAPKIAAVRLLRRLEPSPRGVYTGTIGILLPGGNMAFSVAIRTVVVRDGIAAAGAGGGIVWDSDPAEEFREVHRKALFLTESPLSFDLIETFLWSPETGFRFLPAHLLRLASSARYFGFRFDRSAVAAALAKSLADFRAAHRGPDGGTARVRLLLHRDGRVSIAMTPHPPGASTGTALHRVALSPVTVSSRDPFVRHKTTNRSFRDAERDKAREAGFDEVLFLNERGEVTEGAVTNVFAEVGGRLLTPPVSCGLLGGIFRRRVLADRFRRASERIIFPEDLERADRIFLSNSVRGLLPAVLGRLPPSRETEEGRRALRGPEADPG